MLGGPSATELPVTIGAAAQGSLHGGLRMSRYFFSDVNNAITSEITIVMTVSSATMVFC